MSRSVRFQLTLGALVVAAVLPHLARAEGQQNLQKNPPATDKEADIQVSAIAQPGTSVRAGRAVGIVDASIETVMSIVEDYAGYEKFMPHFRASRVLSRRGESALVYMQASIARGTMTLWCQLKVGPRPNIGNTRVIEAKMVQGNMDAMRARWEVTAVDAQHTRVAFELLMDPKVPLPASLVSDENEKATQKTIRALRHVVAERANAANAKPSAH
jgi:ribosome-associated toxin RatA of RatAB toxin-antitoxin module